MYQEFVNHFSNVWKEYLHLREWVDGDNCPVFMSGSCTASASFGHYLSALNLEPLEAPWQEGRDGLVA
jgi:hypothetical protein